jgi:hypothetical protein
MPTSSPVGSLLPAQSSALRSAAIFILTQNQPLRVASLKTTLYFLFRHFNAHPGGARYPVILLHEGDFSASDQEAIRMGIRRNCRDSLQFEQLDASDFELPPHIDPERLRQSLQDPPVPYWRNDRYRMMCRWWLVHFPRYATRFDYVMRLDDDSFIEEPIADPFVWAAQNGASYVSNQIHLDCGICCLGLKSQFERLFPQRQADLDSLFAEQVVHPADPLTERLRRLSATSGIPLPAEFLLRGRLPMPQIFYNNFFVTRSAFWQRPDVAGVIDQLDRTGGIFYFRWGDAPIQTLLVRLLCPANQVGRFDFRYSKRLQREAFIDGDGGVHSYAPDTYV